MLDLLRVLLKHAADQHGIAPRLIANADDLDRIALDEDNQVKAMHGWRFDIFGQYALAVKKGELALAVKGRSTKLIPIKG